MSNADYKANIGKTVDPKTGRPIDPVTGKPYMTEEEYLKQQRELLIRQQQLDLMKMEMDARPDAPVFKSLLDKDTGLLKKQYQATYTSLMPEFQKKLDAIQLNKEGLEAFRTRALGDIDPLTGKRVVGPSSWAKLMEQKSRAEEQAARDLGAAQSLQAGAQARTQLAMKGGLSSGARERLARQGGIDLMRMNQDTNRSGMMDRMNIGIQDETMRMAALGQLPGMEVQALQPDIEKTKMWGTGQQYDITNQMNTQQFNIIRALEEKRAKDMADQKAYEEQMKAWAAEKQASATQTANSGGCWICTQVNEVHPLAEDEKKLLFRFKKYVLKAHREPARFYLKDCKTLTRKMNEANVDWKEWVGFDNAIMTLIRGDHLESAYLLYRDTVIELVRKYWSDCDHPSWAVLLAEQRADEGEPQEVGEPELERSEEYLLEKLL